MQTTRLTVCSCCERPLLCSEDLARWLEAVVRAGARVYCSLACSAATEAIEVTGDVVVQESWEPLQPSL
ncbi:MAG TPA: hypothetical protein VFF12_07470 [Myxococcaceae bacterium]|nr:hypothetical protein [Myxococcaceae bacterium]